eukprot:538455-Karenia_brevis.AAC.1
MSEALVQRLGLQQIKEDALPADVDFTSLCTKEQADAMVVVAKKNVIRKSKGKMEASTIVLNALDPPTVLPASSVAPEAASGTKRSAAELGEESADGSGQAIQVGQGDFKLGDIVKTSARKEKD